MGPVPTYSQLAQDKQVAENTQMTRDDMPRVEQSTQAQPNMVLQDYINRQSAPEPRGLGNPNAEVNGYTMLATEVANNSTDEIDYTSNMIKLAESGQVPGELVMSDPVVQQVMAAQQNQQPRGLM